MTENERILVVLSGLCFNFNMLSLYLSRKDYPIDLLSKNALIINFIKFVKQVYTDDGCLITSSRLQDMVCRFHNIPMLDIENNETNKKYTLFYDKMKNVYSQVEVADFPQIWKNELKWAKENYVRRHRLELTKLEHAMVKNGCFAGSEETAECPTCPVKKQCKSAIKYKRKSLDFVRLWREEQEEKLRRLQSDEEKIKVIQYHSNIEERLQHYTELYSYKRDNPNKSIGIPFSIPSLTKWTEGWMKGRTYALGARTGKGKTAFALQEAAHVWEVSSTNVLYFNLEMPSVEMQARLDSNRTGEFYSNTLSGNFTREEHVESFKQKLRDMDSLWKKKEYQNEFIILDVANLSLGELIYNIKYYYNMWGSNMLVVLDNLNIMEYPPGKRNEGANEVARVFRLIVKELDIMGFLLIQLNREAEGEKNIQPRHFRDADNIGDHMDGIFALLDWGKLKKALVIVKGRSFAGDTVYLQNNLSTMRLNEIEGAVDEDSFDEDYDKFIMD